LFGKQRAHHRRQFGSCEHVAVDGCERRWRDSASRSPTHRSYQRFARRGIGKPRASQ
jgi:hypothetical protein